VHPTQEIVERGDGSLEISFRVSSMENIIRWILSFGEHARILAPLELQERVRRTIGKMNYLYNRF
jgi:predicted DNA-binding transcriptional regulator YafY